MPGCWNWMVCHSLSNCKVSITIGANVDGLALWRYSVFRLPTTEAK